MAQREQDLAHVLVSLENSLSLIGLCLVGQAVIEEEGRDDTGPDEEEADGQRHEGKLLLGVEERGAGTATGEHLGSVRSQRRGLDVVRDFGESGGLGQEGGCGREG